MDHVNYVQIIHLLHLIRICVKHLNASIKVILHWMESAKIVTIITIQIIWEIRVIAFKINVQINKHIII